MVLKHNQTQLEKLSMYSPWSSRCEGSATKERRSSRRKRRAGEIKIAGLTVQQIDAARERNEAEQARLKAMWAGKEKSNAELKAENRWKSPRRKMKTIFLHLDQ